ncbi:hypothetical protein PAESOLCIP111_02372 [Paenibacillus solanacearum]|uniref:HTH merR-type domain-containing protein n=1 Tax=Paenibacillus solanacearum TaxID=2048548 RepID=A0A916K1T4_9BACL|nr:MerR family transcriptional regulator [Paenibacillus solanacearum]CAG7621897.1 hypothetical protein PAESOLCIP111_02372 [Paenibacillus solanacearum]
MKISQLAKSTGVSARSIRHYEKKKLLTSTRLENDYREFDESAVERVNTIQLYLSLGLTTEDIEQVLNCSDASPEYPADAYCGEMLEVYEQKLQGINKQMSALALVQQRLLQRIGQMKQNRLARCGDH